MKDVRAGGLARWARATDPSIPGDALLEPVSDDASFRRYFRFSAGSAGIVYVDAPPAHEDNESFVKIAGALAQAGLNCPNVLASDLAQGYLAVTDLGDDIYLNVMTGHPERVDALYEDAVSALIRMLSVECELPLYSETRLRDEMSLFTEWFLPQQLGIETDSKVDRMLADVFDLLVDSALVQPQGFVHRDYHCRNLMLTHDNNPGIIDFQDAVIGPVTYDLVSLFKDCYYRFDRARVESEVDRFHQQLVSAALMDEGAPILKWFDLMGAQRHLKCAGIFSRLHLRDGKAGYLGDIPLVIDYLVETAGIYPELADFGDWLTREIVPRIQNAPFNRGLSR
jgi:aminoglycoside/choline kinase family phosphotransferase